MEKFGCYGCFQGVLIPQKVLDPLFISKSLPVVQNSVWAACGSLLLANAIGFAGWPRSYVINWTFQQMSSLMAPVKERAIQRIKARKRKGFFGRCPQDLTTSIASCTLEEINIATADEPGTSSSLTPRPSPSTDSVKNTSASSSITDKKLANSSFDDLLPDGVLTRSSRKALGFSPKKAARKTAEAEDYALVEMSAGVICITQVA